MTSLTARLRNSGGSFAILAGVLIFSLATLGQSNLGRILGSITDPSGSVISGATVTVTDVQRGISRTLTTDQAGGYAAPNLLPGTYTVRAEAKGFKALERSGLVLQVGQDLRIDLPLQVGEQSQTVTVSGEAPLVNVTNSTLGGTLNNEAINDLPLNGRNYQNLVVLRPGSLFYPGGGGWTQSTNGSRPEDNGYIVDGLTNDHPLTGLTIINGAGVEGDAATILPIDAIQEFNVIENPPAEYGWKPGAITNVGLKSGTNNVHGTAYAFGRSDGFDARNYFNPGPTNGNCIIGGSPSPAALCQQTSVDLKQWGGTVGGAIKKDKLFYFLGFEDEHYSLGNLFQRNVPESVAQATPDPRHSLVDAITGLQTAGLPISPVSLKLTGCTLGPPVTCTGGQYPRNIGTSQSVAVGYPSNFASDNGLAKIDYQINSNNTLNGMFFTSRGDITAQDPGTFAELQPYWLSHQINQPTVIDLNWTWTPNSRWVNEARFGVTHMNRATNTLDSNVPATTYGLNTGVSNPVAFGFPNIIVAGLSPLGGFPGWPINFGGTNVFQGVDNISYLRGKHTFKFGAEIHRNTVDEGRFSRGRGLIFFFGNHAAPGTTSLEDFLSGAPTMAQVLVGTNDLHLSDWQYAGWASDDWRMTPRVTLNLGLRYEYLSVLHEANNQLGNFDPTAGLVQVGKQVSSPYNGDHLDFAPRVGLAWDVTGKGTTVVHAGYSIVTDGGLPMFVFIGNGGAQNASTLGLGAIPTAANIVVNGVTTPGTGTIKYSTIGAGGPPLINAWRNNSANTPLFQTTTPQCGDGLGADPGPCSILGVNRNFRTPYVSNWTLGLQHSFTNNLSLNLAYVGNHGSRLPGIVDLNQPAPVANPNNAVLPLAAKFPYLQYVNFLSNLYTSNYNGLQATFTQRVTHGLSFILGYTWSHSLDDQSFNIDTPLPQDSTHPFADYGNSIYDITHRLTLSFTYNLPNKKAPGQMLEGWQLNSIVTIQTGAPWGVTDTSNNISGTSEFSDRWDLAGNAHDFQSNQNSIPYCSGADFTVASSITCTETTPGGSINLPAAQTSAFIGNCLKAAQGLGAATVASLNSFGCFAKGGAVMIPPAAGTWGTMNRDPFRDSGFRDWDLSVTKSWKYKERLTTQFRAEFFNILNHPNFTNPYGGSNGFGDNDPSSPNVFGCGCATPDQAAGNPVLGTGGNRAMQLGLKLIF